MQKYVASCLIITTILLAHNVSSCPYEFSSDDQRPFFEQYETTTDSVHIAKIIQLTRFDIPALVLSLSKDNLRALEEILQQVQNEREEKSQVEYNDICYSKNNDTNEEAS